MKRNKKIPECWDELTPKQFSYLLKKIFVMMGNPEITKEDVLCDFADYLLGRKKYIHPLRKADYLLLVNEAVVFLDWIFTIEGEQVVINFDTVKNLFPVIGKLVGPRDAGYDLRFGEYRKACWLYNQYTTEHDIESLNGLVGILYRSPSVAMKNRKANLFKGDYRETFNEYYIEKYANRVKNIPEHIKWGVYLWFGHFCKYLMTGDFIIDGDEISFSQIFGREENGTDKKDESLGMTSVLFTLAESRTFGNVDETDNALLFKVMLKLLNDDITAKNLKKE